MYYLTRFLLFVAIFILKSVCALQKQSFFFFKQSLRKGKHVTPAST